MSDRKRWGRCICGRICVLESRCSLCSAVLSEPKEDVLDLKLELLFEKYNRRFMKMLYWLKADHMLWVNGLFDWPEYQTQLLMAKLDYVRDVRWSYNTTTKIECQLLLRGINPYQKEYSYDGGNVVDRGKPVRALSCHV